MIPLTLTTNLDIDPWTDLPPDIPFGNVERMGLLPNGTVEGRATVAIVIRLEDGSLVGAQTTLRILNAATHALLASPVAQMEDM